jgi:hypothetical protein
MVKHRRSFQVDGRRGRDVRTDEVQRLTRQHIDQGLAILMHRIAGG